MVQITLGQTEVIEVLELVEQLLKYDLTLEKLALRDVTFSRGLTLSKKLSPTENLVVNVDFTK